MGPPKVADVRRALESALASGLEDVHRLPQGVLLADRDKYGRWGDRGAYFAYCIQCGRWLSFRDGLRHDRCSGRWWDYTLAAACNDYQPQLDRMANRFDRGEDPYTGIRDLRSRGILQEAEGQMPDLVVGSRQLVRLTCPSLERPLDALIDVPWSTMPEDGEGESSGPLRLLLYFHGSGEDYRQAPPSVPGCAVIAASCPKSVRDQRCFWFQEGSGNAWEKHEHKKLRRCEPMLAAAFFLLEAASASLAALARNGVEEKPRVLGVSMGGHAALEFAREFPSHISCVAAIAGYYEEARAAGLVATISALPLLLVHRRGDRCCPFGFVEHLHGVRVENAKEGVSTEAWFSDGDQHGPTTEELEEIVSWLLRWP